MKILISNDDGYDHLGHLTLRRMLEELGHEVWSIAPQQNQSGVGMKLSLGKSLEFKVIDQSSWACSGTPVDCILFALHGLLPFWPDAVISGINAGANLSDDLWYSGTAAAAREASKWGIPALALSYSSPPPYRAQDFASFRSLLGRHLEDLLLACELQEESTGNVGDFVGFLNINIPLNCNGKLQFVSRFELRPYQNILQQTGDNHYMLCGEIDSGQPLSLGVDTTANTLHQASISLGSFHSLQPLTSQLTAASVRDKVDEQDHLVHPELGPLRLSMSDKAAQAMARIIKSGV